MQDHIFQSVVILYFQFVSSIFTLGNFQIGGNLWLIYIYNVFPAHKFPYLLP